MISSVKPSVRPNSANFSSGPCKKRPGWSPTALSSAVVGRSHRSPQAKTKIQELLIRSRNLLELPKDYYIGLVPGSDTGAIEMAMWSLLGQRAVTVLAWENFGQEWVSDAVSHLQLKDCHIRQANYGSLPDLQNINPNHDIVFTWNGTTSGVRVPHAEWISPKRTGLTLCDATSAIFAMNLPWNKLDATTYSWQKVLGGEAAHGMLILSPRAIERLETYLPNRPLPKLFRLTKNGKFNPDPFTGNTINTPSMLCVEDALDTLTWAENIGGLPSMIARSEQNLKTITTWIQNTPWIDFLATNPKTRSCTSICLKITHPSITSLSTPEQHQFIKHMTQLLEDENVAFDINAHKAAPPGLRIWGGVTVEATDIQALLPWIEWAFEQSLHNLPITKRS